MLQYASEPTMGWKRGRYSGVWREVSFAIEGGDLVYRRLVSRQELANHRKARRLAMSWIEGAHEEGTAGASRFFQRGTQWPWSVQLNERGRESVGVSVLHFGCNSKATTRYWAAEVTQSARARRAAAESPAGACSSGICIALLGSPTQTLC